MLDLKKGYETQIISELLSAYLEDRDASIEKICEESTDCNIEEEYFEQLVLDFDSEIREINNYIQEMYGETAFLKLSQEMITKIEDYIKARLGFQIENEFFLAKFNVDNDIKKKRKYLKKIISQYCETGILPEFQYTKDDRLSICRKSYEKLKINLLNFEEEIKKSCNDDIDFFNDYSLGQKLVAYGEALGFSKNASDIMFNFRERLMNEKKISTTLSSLSKTCTFLDKEIVFDGKHFVMEYVTEYCKEQIQPLAITITEINKLDTFSDTILSDIAKMIDRFAKNSFHHIGILEEKLGLERNEEIYQNIYAYVNEKVGLLITAQEIFERIDSDVDIEEAYRRMRKSSRGRWVGGGFGMSGAIKGAATAGVMNLGMGAIHSAVNGLGNVKTNFKASGSKQKIIRDILDDIPENTKKLLSAIHPILIKNIKEKQSEFFWKKDVEKEKEIQERLQSSKDKSEVIAELLSQNPYDVDNYVKAFFILDEKHKLIESDPDLQTLLKISKWFQVDFKTPLRTLLQNDINHNLELTNEYFENIWNRILILCYYPQEKTNCEESIYNILLKKYGCSDLQEYQKNLRILESFFKELKIEELKTWLKKKINRQLKKDIASISEKIEINSEIDERRLQKLIIEKEVASEENKQNIENIVKTYITKKTTGYIDKISTKNPEMVKDIEKQILVLDQKFSTSLGIEILKEVLDKQIICSLQSVKYERDILKLENYISEISDKILDFENRKKDVQEYSHRLKKVYDYMTNYTVGMKEKAYISNTNTGKECDTLEEAETLKAQVMQIKHIYQDCNIEDEKSICLSISKLQDIYSKTGFGMNIIQELETRAKEIDLKERTVLDVVYSTREKAEEERKKVVGNKKYNTEQEAEQERERQKKENALNAFEKKQISDIESNIFSELEILKEIKKRNFKIKFAMEKEKIYEQKVFDEYNKLKSYSTSENLIGVKAKTFLLFIAGVFVTLIGIGMFFSGGLIAKIIAVIFVLWVWECFLEAKDEVDALKENKRKIVDIENTIEIQK